VYIIVIPYAVNQAGRSWTPRCARGSSNDVNLVARAHRALKARCRAALCWIFGCRWEWYLARGELGEPGADHCWRCGAERPNYALPCRCCEVATGFCGCEFPGFAAGE
jgi:hypothetical protein